MAATVVIPIPVDDEEVKAVASLVLSTNSVRFEVGDDEDAIRGKVRDALAIARCASVSEKETCGSDDRRCGLEFARGGRGVREGRRRRWRGDAGGDARARDGGVRIGDAIDRGRDGDGGTRRGVVERACCSRARDGGAEKRGDCEIGAAAAAAARSERGSATAGALDPACEDMFRWARARGAEFRIEGRVVREGMREARATESIEAGECAARVPWSALLGVEQVARVVVADV